MVVGGGEEAREGDWGKGRANEASWKGRKIKAVNGPAGF